MKNTKIKVLKINSLIFCMLFTLAFIPVQSISQTVLGIRNNGNVAKITATQATYIGNLSPFGNGWWMYAGGAPVNPSSQVAYLIKRFGSVIEITGAGAQASLTNLSSFGSPGWNYPMVRMSGGTLVALNENGKLVKIVGTTPSLLADLSVYAGAWARISIDHNNNILAISADGKTVEIEPSGTHSLLVDASGLETGAWLKVLLGSDGNHYLLNVNGKVYRLDACGLQLFVDLGQFNNDNIWQNFANHPNGKIYAVNYEDGQVADIDLTSGNASIITSFGNIYPRFWYGPVIDNAGTIYVWQNFGYFKKVMPNGSSTGLSPDLNSIATSGWYAMAVEQYLTQAGDQQACCPDGDGDTICDDEDNCPDDTNPGQEDGDGDGVGDICDLCIGNDAFGDTDGDGYCDDADNCVTTSNPGQEDADCDDVGDVCDICDGGDDSIDNNNDNLPDCAFPPEFNDIISAWKCGNNNSKVKICHIPPGNPSNPQTNCISYNAVANHMQHGDYLGPCGSANCGEGLQIPEAGHTLSKNNGSFMSIFPNPVRDELSVYLKSETENKADLSIIDQLGRIIISKKKEVDKGVQVWKMDIHDLEIGIYIITVQIGNETYMKRFVKAKSH